MDQINSFRYVHTTPTAITAITAITWNYQGNSYKRENTENRLYADVNYADNLIAIVESPYAIDKNIAYIVNGKNETVIQDIRTFFTQKYRDFGYPVLCVLL